MRPAPLLALLAAAFAFSFFATAAQAQRDRVFVASYGSDSNPCTFGSPCKTFQNAVNVVAVGGEVTAIDSAGFGPISISHAVSITSPNGVEAGIVTPTNSTAISINAGPDDVVKLRGLTIQGASSGFQEVGIMFNTGKSLIVENCVIHDVGGAGIEFLPSATSEMSVLNTIVADTGDTAIQVNVGGTSMVKAAVSLRGVAVYNNFYGVYVVGGSGGLGSVNVNISDSEVDGSTSDAIVSQTSNSVPVAVMVRNSAIAHNATGLAAIGSTAVLRVGQSMLTGNTASWFVSGGGSLVSYADNDIDGNFDGDPTPPPINRK